MGDEEVGRQKQLNLFLDDVLANIHKMENVPDENSLAALTCVDSSVVSGEEAFGILQPRSKEDNKGELCFVESGMVKKFIKDTKYRISVQYGCPNVSDFTESGW